MNASLLEWTRMPRMIPLIPTSAHCFCCIVQQVPESVTKRTGNFYIVAKEVNPSLTANMNDVQSGILWN